MVTKSIRTIYILFLFFLFSLHDNMVYSASNNKEIFHLEKNEFYEFFKKEKYKYWETKFYEYERCQRWQFDFFVWDKIKKEVLVPKRLKPLQDFLDDLEVFYEKDIDKSTRQTFLITKDEMILISLKFLKDGKYSSVFNIKERCIKSKREDEVEFYIIDLRNDGTCLYFCTRDSIPDLKRVTEPPDLNINRWRELLISFDSIRKLSKINFKLTGLIGKKCLSKIITSYYNEIKFWDKSCYDSEATPKLRYGENDKPYPYKKFSFDLSDKTDLNMLRKEGIWLGKSDEKKKLIPVTYSSLYSIVKDRYEESGKQLKENNTVNLFLARTSDFKFNESIFNKKIKDELHSISKALGNYIRWNDKWKKIKIIGYADSERSAGVKDEQRERKNIELSNERAENVKKWLKRSLKNVIGDKDIITVGCESEYFRFEKSKFVEIRVY